MKAFEGNLDVFESMFNRSVKHHYEFQPVKLNSLMIIAESDHLNSLDEFGSKYCENRAKYKYTSDFSWSDLLNTLEETKPDLLLMQRQLGIPSGLKFSLGPILISLSQELEIPILILPTDYKGFEIRNVLAGFDHQIDNSHLVNHSLILKKEMERLVLVHVEEESVFNYYVDAIAKIPGINTDYARTAIEETILNLAGDFFKNVKDNLNDESFKVYEYCKLGDVVNEYKEIISEHSIDLMVFEAQDDSKLAMHSLGQSLAIQFPQLATLLV